MQEPTVGEKKESTKFDTKSLGVVKPSTLVPFLILAGVNLAVAVVFYRVVKPLFLPLFLAAVLAMLTSSMHQWLSRLLRGYERLAAMLVTLFLLTSMIAPITLGVARGARELLAFRELVSQDKIEPFLDPQANPWLAKPFDWLEKNYPSHVEDVRARVIGLARSVGEALYHRTAQFIGDVPGFLLAIVMFIIAYYYFLVDGPRILEGWRQLTPLDPEHDRTLRQDFCVVCRGVVWATIAAAVAQGVLFGIALAVLGLIFPLKLGGWVVLLSIATVFFSMVPLVGSAAVWGTVSVLLIARGHYAAGVILIVYGAAIISSADNLIKVYVLKGQANLHPLLVFVCVFGGIDLFGVLGIFIGPLVGAVLFSLLRILRSELTRLGATPPASTIATSAKANIV